MRRVAESDLVILCCRRVAKVTREHVIQELVTKPMEQLQCKDKKRIGTTRYYCINQLPFFSA